VKVAVVGGGISGLAAALRIRERAPAGTAVTVYEQAPWLGGKLRTGTVAGSTVELGAEAFLVRDTTGGDSAAVSLARRVGLGDDLVHPAVQRAGLAHGGRLVPLPGGTLVGVPSDLESVKAVAEPAADLDTDEGRPLLGPDEDVAVGALVRRRLGDEVVDRLVDPMLGGVYAGRADELSLAATMPGLAAAARTEHTLTGAVKAALAAAPRPPGTPVFATVQGGLSRLVRAVAAATDARIRLGTAVRELRRVAKGWELLAGTERVHADAVVLAVPARHAARLLHTEAVVDYASVALVTLALPGARLPDLSGFLVPAEEGTLMKAATFFTTKWAHLTRPDGVAIVRGSVGRYGEEPLLHRSDTDLAAHVHRELSTLVGAALPPPVGTHVRRWGGSLPQYAPGHLDRVAEARGALPPTLALAGAGYDGVGIPACVRSGEAAADQVLKGLSP
jgi:oxygen-dependent protoporphyrinogen oxidase